MAALTRTDSTLRLPFGNYFLQIFRVTTTGISQTDESVETDMTKVIAAAVVSMSDDSNQTGTPNVILNATGTGSAEDTTNGEIAVESIAADELQVVAIGRP